MVIRCYIWLLVLTPAWLWCDSVGLNFVGAAGDGVTGTDLLPPDSAGQIAQTNWNNGPKSDNQPTPVPLHNDLGNPTTMAATWFSSTDWRASPNQSTAPLFDGSVLQDACLASASSSTLVANQPCGYSTITFLILPSLPSLTMWRACLTIG